MTKNASAWIGAMVGCLGLGASLAYSQITWDGHTTGGTPLPPSSDFVAPWPLNGVQAFSRAASPGYHRQTGRRARVIPQECRRIRETAQAAIKAADAELIEPLLAIRGRMPGERINELVGGWVYYRRPDGSRLTLEEGEQSRKDAVALTLAAMAEPANAAVIEEAKKRGIEIGEGTAR